MGSRKNPHKIKNLPEAELNLLKSICKNFRDDLVLVGEKNYLAHNEYVKYADEIYNFPLRKSDVWVVTLPRSGTTLTQEMTWQICNNCDYETGFKIPLTERFPFFEFSLYDGKESPANKFLEEFKDDPVMCARIKNIFTLPWDRKYGPSETRFIKTHYPLSLLPPELLTTGCKVIYVARTFKDHLISRYNQDKQFSKRAPENFADFYALAERGLISDYPYFDHIKEGWDLRDHENLLFLFYEDIVKNTEEAIKKVAKFLAKTLTQTQIDKLVEHLKVENFKKNDSVNRDYADLFRFEKNEHVRQGKVGSWKNECFSKELSEKADKWIEDNCKKTGIIFPIS